MSGSSAVNRDTPLLRSDNLSDAIIPDPPLSDKEKALKGVRKAIKKLEQRVGVLPKQQVEILKNIIMGLKK